VAGICHPPYDRCIPVDSSIPSADDSHVVSAAEGDALSGDVTVRRGRISTLRRDSSRIGLRLTAHPELRSSIPRSWAVPLSRALVTSMVRLGFSPSYVTTESSFSGVASPTCTRAHTPLDSRTRDASSKTARPREPDT